MSKLFSSFFEPAVKEPGPTPSVQASVVVPPAASDQPAEVTAQPPPVEVAPVGVASPAPPSGGPQPAQPAQPVTSATTTVSAVKPAASVSGTPTPVKTGGAASKPRGGGRKVFVQTTSVGLTTPAQTTKQTLLGS